MLEKPEMPIAEQQLLQIFPNAGPRAGFFVPALNAAMEGFGIDSLMRGAAFLAQPIPRGRRPAQRIGAAPGA